MGRHLCKNVRQSDNELNSILKAWNNIERVSEKIKDDFYGDGHTAEKIVSHIGEYLYAGQE